MDSNLITNLQKVIGSKNVLTNDELNTRYHHIWHMDKPLNAKAVVMPKSTNDVSEIMKICHKHNQSVVVHGGLTNLVGSTETLGDEIVISTEKMNTIDEIDKMSRTMTVSAGVILEHIQDKATENGLLFPLNFGAKGSAQIGGVISTNAGGLRVIRYGMTRNLVLGLEVVLADGTILSSLKKIIKDNSAYDIKQLFIGSEGTLGIVTKAVLKLSEAPKSRTTAFIGFNDYENVVSFLRFMDGRMAGTLSGFELIWKDAYIALTSEPSTYRPPLPYDYEYYVLVEGLGSNYENDQALLQDLLEEALGNEMVLDAVLAQSESDLNWFWNIRENVDMIVYRCTYDQHFDISLPISEIGKTIASMTEELKTIEGVEQVFSFGHVADGNIHFMIGKANTSQKLTNAINDVIYSPLQALGGSVSAEHGIGTHKKRYLKLCRTAEEIQLMKTLKKTLDPKNILNPGKVLDVD